MSRFSSLAIAPSMVESADVPFGEWLPDLPELNNPGAIEALNVLPSEGCYVPAKTLTPSAGVVLPSAAKGGITTFAKNGQPVLYAADNQHLYVREMSTFTTKYTNGTPLSDSDYWQFVQFGQQIVALHPQLAPVATEVGGVSPFTPLGGSPPTAYVGGRLGDFLVLGNLTADPDDPNPNDAQPQRIRWSGFNNIDAPWISDPATQADFNDMPAEGGGVMAITGREFGSIFQQRSISRMTYVGLPAVFDIQTVETARGAISIGAVLDIGAYVFFIADDGFFIWNGTNSTPIGDNKTNRYFFNRLNYGQRQRITGAVDYINSCVMWAFPVGTGLNLSEIIVYSYKENRFTHIMTTTEFILSGASFNVTLDELTGNLDTDYPISFDDFIYYGGRPSVAGFTTAHNFGFFNGVNMEATVDTGEYTGPGGTRVAINGAMPMVDISVPAVTVATARRDQLIGEAIVFDTPVAQEITGECPVLSDARYTRFRTFIPAGTTWRHARGVQAFRKTTGTV